jgi:RNA polymerase sigma factor (sigma-70 family)
MNLTADRRQWVLAALDQFEARLLHYAERLLGDLDEARDVVQFVFLRLCDESPEEIGDRLAQWLYTVCRNRALDVLRASGRVVVGWASPTDPNQGGGHSPPYGCSEPRSGRETDPADAAEQGELHALLRQLVDQLPGSQREAIDLWTEGFRYVEISRILARHEGHVRVLVHRGLKTLREHPQVRALLLEDAEIVPRRKPVGNALRGVP